MVNSMIENKKEPDSTLEAYSMPTTEKDKPIKKEKTKKEKKQKKIKAPKVPKTPKEKEPFGVIMAKIVVFLIVTSTILLGLYKLTLHLNEPKTMFYTLVSDVYDDFSLLMDKLQTEKLFSILSSNGVEINADVEIEATDLKDEFAGLESTINSLAYSTTMKLIKDEGYLETTTRLKKDDVERLNSSRVLNKNKNLFSAPNLFEGWYESTFNTTLISFNAEKNLVLAQIIKNELQTALDEEKFSATEEAIALNGKTVDCEKSTYTFSGDELISSIDRITEAVSKNSIAYYYVAQLFGVNASEINAKMNEFKTKLNIDKNDTYELSSYMRKDNNVGVRFELVSKTNQNLEFSYTLDDIYRKIEYRSGRDTNIVEVKGNLEDSATIIVEDQNYVVTLVKSDREKMTNCAINVVTAGAKENVLDVSFQYTLTEESTSVHRLAVGGEVKNYKNGKTTAFKIKSNALINSNIKVDKMNISNNGSTHSFGENDKTTLRTNFANFLKNLDTPPVEPPASEDIPATE